MHYLVCNTVVLCRLGACSLLIEVDFISILLREYACHVLSSVTMVPKIV